MGDQCPYCLSFGMILKSPEVRENHIAAAVARVHSADACIAAREAAQLVFQGKFLVRPEEVAKTGNHRRFFYPSAWRIRGWLSTFEHSSPYVVD